ncbi:glycosyl hydrolase family 88 [Mucilaginibacter gracilis]|uniref:Glycosyl hydrolase family 88 n=1 Tax=Mucilaginibacter gracilis TaxID=423350 RepID=A0A495J6T0_9SPHI|nr:glycoside hydrolase family 88 protein [Mucilaginibacter gracilis]RKR84587.1 glycosyl hydrolase family 88 [Mucilaginibacter gracilis]
MTSIFKYRSLYLLVIMLCGFQNSTNKSLLVQQAIGIAKQQMLGMINEVGNRNGFPRSVNVDGTLRLVNKYDWCSGFFAGNLWYTYEATGDNTLRKEATRLTDSLEPLKNYTLTHDLGFMMYCSYGNAYRLTGEKHYKDVLIQAAKSLSSRYSPVVKCIKSWDDATSWRDHSKFDYPVIIDNMMNLELLFFASKVTGDPSFKTIAINHALTTLKNHLRSDYSAYHVVNYYSKTGKVKTKETNQGFSDNSAWSRGQAWGIYGFTVAYRETKDKRFLIVAQKMAEYFINHKNLPQNKIPYWDFDVNKPGFKSNWNYNASEYKIPPRDASAAAVVCSALFELCKYSGAKNSFYKNTAVQILLELASESYLAKPGSNHHFLLMHCVGNYPLHSEIDVPLVYADYYFLEALLRYKKSNVD